MNILLLEDNGAVRKPPAGIMRDADTVRLRQPHDAASLASAIAAAQR